jgi:biopolymer transport protein TolR
MQLQKRGSDAPESLAEINITPMVDVMLVLLIIFMVTAPMLQEGIDINLPNVSAAGVESAQDDFIVSIDDVGQIYFNENSKEKFSIINVEDKLMEAFKDRPKKELYLKADKAIKYGFVMQVMGAAQRAGVEKIGMITAAPDDDTKQTKTN